VLRQDCLQGLAEVELPESQCGFRRGRGYTDMMFMVRQLSEKAFEHNTKQFFALWTFRKLMIRFHTLWIALKKLGVPETMIELVKSFHCV